MTVLVASLPPYFVWGRKDEATSSCRIDTVFKSLDRPALIYILVLYCVPVALTNVIYVAVLCRMRARLITVQPASHAVHFRNVQRSILPNTLAAPNITVKTTHQPRVPTNSTSGLGFRMNKVYKVIGYLLLVMNISILSPVVVFSMMLGGHYSVPPAVQVLTYFNNISSPFIYSLSIGPLREELKKNM